MGNIDQERVGLAQIGKKVVWRLETFRTETNLLITNFRNKCVVSLLGLVS